MAGEGRRAVTGRKVLDTCAERFDAARDLPAERGRRIRQVLIRPLRDQQIREVQAASANGDADFAFGGIWPGDAVNNGLCLRFIDPQR